MRILFRAFADECHALLHSVSALTVLVLGVLFYSLLYPLPYLHEAPQKLPLLVADQDRSTSSRTLLRMINATEGVTLITTYTNSAKALDDLRDGRGEAVLIIPNDFERNLLRGSRSILPVYLDAAYLLPYRVAYRGIKLAVENMGAGVRVLQFEGKGMPSQPALALQLRGQFNVRTLYNPAGNYAQSTVPAVFVLILQQTLLIGSAMLATRVYAPATSVISSFAPSKRSDTNDADSLSARYLLGRLLFLVCLYLLHAVYYLWFLPMFHDLPRAGSTGQVLLFLLPFFLACGAAGTVFASMIRKPEYILMAALPCSLPLLFLSGFAWPPEAMPKVLDWMAQIIPSTPAINGYLLLSQREASLMDIAPLWGQLWGLALFFFALAWGLTQRAGQARTLT